MNSLIRANDVSGLPVVSIDTGEDIAEIRDVVYDAGRHELVGFTLNKRGFLAGRMKEMLSISALFAVGPQAVTVQSAPAIEQADDDVKSTTNDAINVMGNRVLNAEGTALGTVAGVILSTGEKPKAVGYEIKPDTKGGPNVFVPISAQIALSNDNLLLPSEATPLVRDDLEQFATAITTHLEGTN